MNILYEKLPDYVVVDNEEYKIVTDFREWIKFSDMVSDESLSNEDKTRKALDWYIEDCPVNKDKSFIELGNFYCMKELQIPRKGNSKSKKSQSKKEIFSYFYDAPFIISGFMECYKIDLEYENMHWWKFKSLLDGLDKDCAFKERIAYRGTRLSEIKDKNERARIKKIQSEIALPHNEISDNDIANAFARMM